MHTISMWSCFDVCHVHDRPNAGEKDIMHPLYIASSLITCAVYQYVGHTSSERPTVFNKYKISMQFCTKCKLNPPSLYTIIHTHIFQLQLIFRVIARCLASICLDMILTGSSAWRVSTEANTITSIIYSFHSPSMLNLVLLGILLMIILYIVLLW